MALKTELIKIKESGLDEINDVIRQKIDESLIDEYPATGVHQFYSESFFYKDYGYNIAINMFFNIKRYGEVSCCQDSLFLGVTPCQDTIASYNEAKIHYQQFNFLCFSQNIGKNNASEIVEETHSKARNQIDYVLEKQKSIISVMQKVRR
ncbi:MAG: hypothetical protein JXA38_01615 [Methanosarcinaceae archaeon]|nr:hypothetical protein [Methanosarcinaceae archaeon]